MNREEAMKIRDRVLESTADLNCAIAALEGETADPAYKCHPSLKRVLLRCPRQPDGGGARRYQGPVPLRCGGPLDWLEGRQKKGDPGWDNLFTKSGADAKKCVCPP